jgi:hypothetical protein
LFPNHVIGFFQPLSFSGFHKVGFTCYVVST